jgi:hypothetical protein
MCYAMFATSGLLVIHPLRTPPVRAKRPCSPKGGGMSWMQPCFKTLRRSGGKTEPLQIRPAVPASAHYRNPSTKKMSPSECSIPEKRKARPSDESVGPQTVNKPGRSAILRTC